MNDLLYTVMPDNEHWGTGCLVLRNGCILLGLRSDNKLWASPGGKVDPGENPIQAIIREVKEETDLDVNQSTLKFVHMTYSLNEVSIWNSFIFVYDSMSGEPKPQPGEYDELKWVPIENLFDYNLFTPTKEAVMLTLQRNPEFIYPSLAIEKMTSIEQLVDIKNPGSNGGTGSFGTGGWNYKKPGATHSSPNGKTTAQQGNNSNTLSTNKLTELKQSYIQYFQNKKDFKKIYTNQDGKFNFPEYKLAKQDGLVEDKKSYMLLFKEQYVHFALTSTPKSTTNNETKSVK